MNFVVILNFSLFCFVYVYKFTLQSYMPTKYIYEFLLTFFVKSKFKIIFNLAYFGATYIFQLKKNCNRS